MQAYYYRRWAPLEPPNRNWTQLANAETLTDAIGVVSPLAIYAPMEIGFGDGETIAHITMLLCTGER